MKQPVINCVVCGSAATLDDGSARCSCGISPLDYVDGIYRLKTANLDPRGEARIRNLQATTYLEHGKFPPQLASFDQWLHKLDRQKTSSGKAGIALDLGCGPGPFTRRLQQAGYEVLAVDFSLQSLEVNAAGCRDGGNAVTFLHADLNSLTLQAQSVDVVVMADFLQHLGSRALRERLLGEVFAALKPQGALYLSFFNLNVKNYFGGNVHGDFAHGRVQYERLTPRNVLAFFPPEMVVQSVRGMNICNSVVLDRLANALPGALWLARMAVITATKQAVTTAP